MAGAGVCCGSLEDPAALMKTGLSVILVGHVNFLLGALVHGVVLRHINLHKHARAMDHAIANVIAIASGMLGVVVGILAIILSKNMRRKRLKWSLFAVSLLSALMAAASTIGLFVSLVRAIINGGRSLLTHCRFPDAIGYSSVTYECPFDPTRIYSTTLILWVPLIVTCVIQLVFSARCLAACSSFLGLPCCPARPRGRYTKAISVKAPMKEISRYAKPPRTNNERSSLNSESVSTYVEPTRLYAEPPRSSNTRLGRNNTAPPRQQQQQQAPPPPWRQPQSQSQSRPQPLPRRPQSLPASERQPLRRSDRGSSDTRRSETRGGSRRAREQPLLRGTVERSSVWI
ncbi:keratinocyte-associated protein 3 [Kryptolebias marmoratus]|uniref:Transmembrane protein 54b n=1 Tax=Kryptolebias marmoratus TaxID=37003 RepID=A0A3Q2ZHG5_KRYMA|nr:keratinocyte-associated protein 3 [Kryptolebias marmoratus]